VKYVLLFVETEQFTTDMAAMGEAERQRAYDRRPPIAAPCR
jgi:hypothetical protein